MKHSGEIQSVAIVGVGLIGGSFGLALREAGFTGDLIGVSSAEALAAGTKAGAITRAASLAEALSAADLVYLAQPVDRILKTLEIIRPHLRAGALVTDAGSTKQAIVARGVTALPLGSFLGGHPMAGKEQRGAKAAEPGLFRNRPYILTPVAPDTPVAEDFRRWLARCGANVMEMSASAHDRVVAFTSHLPQLISSALALTLARQSNPLIAEVHGQGLLDMTRLAISSPELWIPIISTNRTTLLASINEFVASLNEIRDAEEGASAKALFESGAGLAKRIRSD